ncbi:hypothetical protein KY284_013452 [Solanum tuberosum]|nr:hypothetical protein KY284_013452 [Solanum tuberosum]
MLLVTPHKLHEIRSGPTFVDLEGCLTPFPRGGDSSILQSPKELLGRASERKVRFCEKTGRDKRLGRGRGIAQHSQTSSEATCSGRGLERGKRPVEHEDTSGGQTRPFKRPRMVGIGIYQAEDGFTTLNHLGLPSRRVINTGIRVTKRADVVTGDIGYTPVRGFKWKGKTTISSSNLERMRDEKVVQTRSAAVATANSQSQTTSSRKTFVPWK